MKMLSLSTTGIEVVLESLKRPTRDLSQYIDTVRPIIEAVQKEGDEAIRTYSKKFDDFEPGKLRVPEEVIRASASRVSEELIESMRFSIENIRTFHGQSQSEMKEVETTAGVSCKYLIRPIERVGLYIPGGTAPLFSTLLMLAVPAQLAGVKSIALCTPPQKEQKDANVIYAAANLLGLDEIYSVGGAQAIAALAYGTETIPKVDKIAGPGNAYVTAAKALVSIDPGGADIEMLAGPSELLIIADTSANPRCIAADMLSQAEHGMGAQVVLLTTSEAIAKSVLQELREQLLTLPRKDIASESLERSCIIITETLEQAIDLSNSYAPEHLSLQTNNTDTVLESIQNAGSVFVGPYTPETVGDYCSGTNHVLPTSGTARTQSGVSVRIFQKQLSIQKLNEIGLNNLKIAATILARAEGLEAHARAVEIRFAKP